MIFLGWIEPWIPPFVWQANIAGGHQQVNNLGENPPNELLEDRSDERLDFGAQAEAGRGDPALETVGAIDGAKNGAGKA